MSNKFKKSFQKFDKSLAKEPNILFGELGIPLGGKEVVEVSTRNGFVYVRLRSNTSEIIQAFNDKVSPAYGLPVLVVREGNRYIIKGRDTERYSDWGNDSPYLPRHGNAHSFNPDGSGGGDMVWVYGQQIMPALTFPSGTYGADNVLIASYPLKNLNGDWMYVGNTGTPSLTQYNPVSGSTLVLISIDTNTGNPYLQATTGTYIPITVTGIQGLMSYLPTNNNHQYMPDSFVRLESGTSAIDWANIYDLRQFIPVFPTGTSWSANIDIEDEGASVTSTSTLNFVGDNVSVSLVGDTARIFITGSVSGQPGGSNKDIQFNDNGVLGGESDLTWNKTTNTLLLKGANDYGIIQGVSDGVDSYGLWLYGGDATGSNVAGGDVELDGGGGNGNGGGGEVWLYGGAGGSNGDGGGIFIYAGSAGGGNNDGGDVFIYSGIKSGAGVNGKVYINGRDASTFITGSNQDHELLNNLLGGAANEHYHLTSDQDIGLVSGTVTTLHNHAHNSLSGIQGGGVLGDIYHLSVNQINELVSGTSTSLHSHSIATGTVTPDMLAVASAQYKYLVSGATPFAYAESAGALNIASGKTLAVSNSITLAGTDATTMTFPNVSATIPGLAIENVFTVNQSIVGSTDAIQLKVKANATQTANLQEWQNSGGTVLGSVSGIGNWGMGVAPIAGAKINLASTYADASGNGITTLVTATTTADSSKVVIGIAGQSLYAGSNNLTASFATSSYPNGGLVGFNGTTVHSGSGIITTMIGVTGQNLIRSGAVATNVYGFVSYPAGIDVGTTGTATNLYGYYYKNPYLPGKTLTVTNDYGLYIENVNLGGTLNYSIYTNAGLVHFGDTVDLASGKNLTLLAGNITTDTTTGTKIGASDTAKISMYNATPIVRQNHIIDATDAASAITQINAILAAIENFGIVKTA